MSAVSTLRLGKIVQTVIGMDRSRPAEQGEGASGRSVVLVTGMSGSGKSTALAELKRRGHRVIDTDDPGWIVEALAPDGPEPIWDIDRIKALIDGHRMGWLFIAGCVANQGAVYDRFDAVVLLSAPVDVILDRVASRANPFGATAEDRTKIANDLAAFEPLLRGGADREIVTTAPVPEVVAALEQIASSVAD
jgi:RNase adaptor protein for sRNA GlmZ degradation